MAAHQAQGERRKLDQQYDVAVRTLAKRQSTLAPGMLSAVPHPTGPTLAQSMMSPSHAAELAGIEVATPSITCDEELVADDGPPYNIAYAPFGGMFIGLRPTVCSTPASVSASIGRASV